MMDNVPRATFFLLMKAFWNLKEDVGEETQLNKSPVILRH